MRADNLKQKTTKIKQNLQYIIRNKRPWKFEQDKIVFYRFFHLQRKEATNHILYRLAIVLEVLSSGAYAYIHSLITTKVLKYSFLYLKKLKDLNQISRLSLPVGLQQRILEAMPWRQNTQETEIIPETMSSSEPDDPGLLGYGSKESIGRVSDESQLEDY